MSGIKELDQCYVASTYGRFPAVLKEGKGSEVFDEDGKRYIDMGSGIGVNLFGYSDEVWKQAVVEQLNALQHTSNLYYTGPCAKLAEQLCRRTGLKKVFFCNSGAEANECAIKAARRYAEINLGPEYTTIITLNNSFHGRTLTTLAATGQAKFHELFQPLTPGFVHADANDLEGLEVLLKAYPTAAVMIECVQGEGGVNVLETSYIEGITKLAETYGFLLIDDEVQTGNGRTGKLFAYMHTDVVPDIVTTAKGLGGGLPIGACMLGGKVQDIFHPGDNGSTFGGNPAVCAGALANLNRLDEAFLEEVNWKSAHIFERLSNQPGIRSLSGNGLMIGIEPEQGTAASLAQKILEGGVLVLTAGGNKVRLLPPLNIPDELLVEALDVILQAFASQKG